jgi:hypothetical protein
MAEHPSIETNPDHVPFYGLPAAMTVAHSLAAGDGRRRRVALRRVQRTWGSPVVRWVVTPGVFKL